MGRRNPRRRYQVRAVLLPIAIIATSLFGMATASADEVSVPPVTIPPTDTDFTQVVSVQQFDPALGTLTGVRVEITGGVTGTMGIENTSTSSTSTATLTLSADVEVFLTSDPSIAATPSTPSASESVSLALYDGVLDFDGDSGEFFDSINGADTTTTTLTDAALLAAATGTGTVDLTVDASATSGANATGGNTVTQFLTQASAEILVTYIFDTPSIDIEKSTNGEDADTPTGPDVPVGDPVLWEYVVTNDGAEDLTDVVVVDDQGVTVSCPQDTLVVGESMTCTASGTAVLGQYANIGTVTALSPSEEPVTDSDPSHYRGVADLVEALPAIDIVKDPDTQTVVSGEDATFTITVTNPGPVDLVNVEVTDPLAPDCDNVIGDLAIDASVTYTCTVTGVTAGFTNVATVTGDDGAGNSVSDEDDAIVIVAEQQTPQIEIVKDPDLQMVTLGGDDTATWTIVVTNPGPVDLVNVVVTDPQAPGCDRTIGDLAVGDSFDYECSLSGVTAAFTNVATVTGEDASGNQVTDSDDADVAVGLVASGSESERIAVLGMMLLGFGAALLGFGRRRRTD